MRREDQVSIRHKAFIVGAFEHPTRKADGLSLARLHADVALGAMADAGVTSSMIDGYFYAGDAPGFGAFSIPEYLGINPRHIDGTDVGGSSYLAHVAHAAEAIAAGRCSVALVAMAGRPRAARVPIEVDLAFLNNPAIPEVASELPYDLLPVAGYAMCARRHMHQFGTTSEQLAWVKVAASHHAQHNPNAMLRNVVTTEDVLSSPMLSDPLHRLDCCVVSDGGGAVIVASPEIARSLSRPLVAVRGAGEAVKGLNGGFFDITSSAAVQSGRDAFEMAGIDRADIKYASIYDSFTITVVVQLEDLGFCEKGKGGAFVADGNLISGVGRLPFNTDGGGLCNNHPGNRGGITKIIEAVRQLRGEAHPAVQVPNCDLAIAHGTGGSLGVRHAGATLILERM